MLTVIAAMEQELAGLRKRLKASPIGPVELHVVGIGKEQVESNVNKILDSSTWPPPDGLLLLGFAGGMDPSESEATRSPDSE